MLNRAQEKVSHQQKASSDNKELFLGNYLTRASRNPVNLAHRERTSRILDMSVTQDIKTSCELPMPLAGRISVKASIKVKFEIRSPQTKRR